ncbi:L-sorbose 1-dehydrogenase-like [Oppia nitens]|uniref:L-sorbose 1-dehydrogenase-like n=1 Tax=Oppia nitens TaxID=1686743 RepID=UPI0023DB4C38|nr:L-sorbose 1-dehydrogenase-like [Oppia nitens]
MTVTAALSNLEYRHNFTARSQPPKAEYDYIVIGAGTAGATVAARLSELSNVQVLLLEAGGPGNFMFDAPVLANLVFNGQWNWNYTNTKQSVGVGLKNKVIPEYRGYALGGSSSINSMVYNRGNTRGYDDWANNYGASGWGWNDVRKYFLKYEDNTDSNLVKTYPGWHSTGGPVQITTWANPDPIYQLMIQANNELGYPTTDINGPNQLGIALVQEFASTRGVRSSSSNSYLEGNRRPNLDISVHSRVTRVLFNGHTATGVEYVRDGLKNVAKVKKEIIISAGAINTPQLLMLSGIGPAKDLRKFSIKVLADLPVGINLHNHPRLDLRAYIKDDSLVTTSRLQDAEALTIPALYQWFTNGSGPLIQYHDTITYYNSRNNRDKNWPDLALEVRLYKQHKDVQLTAQDFDDVYAWTQWLQQYANRYFLQILPYHELPRSRGQVFLKSKNPFEAPIIDQRFLTNPKDMEEFIEIVGYGLYVAERSSLAQYLLPMKPIPGCHACPDKSYLHECDSYIRCLIKEVTLSGLHDCCSVRMGNTSKKDTVVDTRLRVKGFKKLRVCDTSVWPVIPNGNINAATFMTGEKCAEMIKEDNK